MPPFMRSRVLVLRKTFVYRRDRERGQEYCAHTLMQNMLYALRAPAEGDNISRHEARPPGACAAAAAISMPPVWPRRNAIGAPFTRRRGFTAHHYFSGFFAQACSKAFTYSRVS